MKRILLMLSLALCTASVQANTDTHIIPSGTVFHENDADHNRIIAIGDLHGDLGNTVELLRLAGLIDEALRWAGGNAVLVQIGDITDRGPDSRAIIDLLRRLEIEAEASGGHVIALLGNHEAMNLTGDVRYVHPGDTAAFGGAKARTAALSPRGDYGSWLATRDTVALVGNTVFVHAGISPKWAALGVDGLNEAVRSAIRAGRGEVLGPNGPLWYRAYAKEPESVICPQLEFSLAQFGARRMVVGHTTRRDGRIEIRCDGRLAIIDIGISNPYGGNRGALEMQTGAPDALYAVYPAGRILLSAPQ